MSPLKTPLQSNKLSGVVQRDLDYKLIFKARSELFCHFIIIFESLVKWAGFKICLIAIRVLVLKFTMVPHALSVTDFK